VDFNWQIPANAATFVALAGAVMAATGPPAGRAPGLGQGTAGLG
jgi:hypothetical protein